LLFIALVISSKELSLRFFNFKAELAILSVSRIICSFLFLLMIDNVFFGVGSRRVIYAQNPIKRKVLDQP
jgi:hypothetical protein